jgi:DNA polymerase III subunit delta'
MATGAAQQDPSTTRHPALGGTERHPHAAAVLAPALAPGGTPSHAYLFHGPAGAGKREVARAMAAALLAKGASSPETVAERVGRESHPDLTWVRPSGAAEMLVGDIDEAVVAAASMTPFESARRVFVIEAAETLNDQAANRLLKTLEEPPPFVHLLLLSDRLQDVMGTIVSRCQLVRFDPLPAELIEASLTAGGVEEQRARAAARLAMGDAALAERLAAEEGTALRACAEALARAALTGDTAGRPWLGLLEAAKAAGSEAGERSAEVLAGELELLPAKERKKHEREALDARRRGERRARTGTLDLGLRLTELWLRDLLCVAEGADELIYAVDRRAELEADAALAAQAGGERTLERAIELVGATRLSLSLNVSEELALESLAYGIGGTHS